jgi:hypothetical protein
MSEVRLCQRCQAEIPADRVEVMPETRVCVECSREIGGEFRIRARRTSLGKAGSLKKNYGDVDVEFVRKPIPPRV